MQRLGALVLLFALASSANVPSIETLIATQLVQAAASNGTPLKAHYFLKNLDQLKLVQCSVCPDGLDAESPCTISEDTKCGASSTKGLCGVATSFTHNDGTNPGKINLANSGLDAKDEKTVVVMGPLTYAGSDRAIVRALAQDNGYKTIVVEAPRQDGPHANEASGWLVVEKGTGDNYHVGTMTLGTTRKTVTLPSKLGNRPLIFPFVQSNNNGLVNNIGSNVAGLRGFMNLRLSMSDNAATKFGISISIPTGRGNLNDETVGYFAIPSNCPTQTNGDQWNGAGCTTSEGTITLSGKTYRYAAGVHYSNNNHMQWNSNVPFGITFTNTPALFVQPQTSPNSIPCEVRINGQPSKTQFTYALENEAGSHPGRQAVAWLAIEP